MTDARRLAGPGPHGGADAALVEDGGYEAKVWFENGVGLTTIEHLLTLGLESSLLELTNA